MCTLICFVACFLDGMTAMVRVGNEFSDRSVNNGHLHDAQYLLYCVTSIFRSYLTRGVKKWSHSGLVWNSPFAFVSMAGCSMILVPALMSVCSRILVWLIMPVWILCLAVYIPANPQTNFSWMDGCIFLDLHLFSLTQHNS